MEHYTYLVHHGIKGQKWGARANAIATRQQLQSFYGANVDKILETKYEKLH